MKEGKQLNDKRQKTKVRRRGMGMGIGIIWFDLASSLILFPPSTVETTV